MAWPTSSNFVLALLDWYPHHNTFKKSAAVASVMQHWELEKDIRRRELAFAVEIGRPGCRLNLIDREDVHRKYAEKHGFDRFSNDLKFWSYLLLLVGWVFCTVETFGTPRVWRQIWGYYHTAWTTRACCEHVTVHMRCCSILS